MTMCRQRCGHHVRDMDDGERPLKENVRRIWGFVWPQHYDLLGRIRTLAGAPMRRVTVKDERK